MGYSDDQIRDLAATVQAAECDVVIIGAPTDLSHRSNRGAFRRAVTSGTLSGRRGGHRARQPIVGTNDPSIAIRVAVAAPPGRVKACDMSESEWFVGDGRPGQALRECLVAATAAPSIHNTQPWLFRLRGNTVDVLVDRYRQLPILDPEGREMLISIGAAVFNLRLALRAHGREARVRLLPDRQQVDLVATLSTQPATAPAAAAVALAETIPRRHTNRRPFANRPVPDQIMAELSAAAVAEQASLLAVDPALRDGVLSLTRTAENRMRKHPGYRTELAAWTTPGGVGRRDGVPRQAFGPRDPHGALPLRDFALGHGAPTATVAFEPDPTLLLLFTEGDAPADWLRAGGALQRVLLTATLRGLAATPLSQIVEIPRLRALLADSTTGEVVQTVLRIGYPTAPALGTPRRPIEDVIMRAPDGST
jgi:nitroreductase